MVLRLAYSEHRTVLVSRTEARNRIWQLVRGHDVDEAGHDPGLGGIDRNNARTGDIKGDELDVKHALERNVREELLGPAHAFAATEAPHAGADRVSRVSPAAHRCVVVPVPAAAGVVARRQGCGRARAGPTSLGRCVHGLDHPLVTAATAQIARETLTDLFVVRLWILVQQRLGGHQHAWNAEPALDRTVVEEGLLQDAQLTSPCKPFDRGNFGAVGLDS